MVHDRELRCDVQQAGRWVKAYEFWIRVVHDCDIQQLLSLLYPPDCLHNHTAPNSVSILKV